MVSLVFFLTPFFCTPPFCCAPPPTRPFIVLISPPPGLGNQIRPLEHEVALAPLDGVLPPHFDLQVFFFFSIRYGARTFLGRPLLIFRAFVLRTDQVEAPFFFLWSSVPFFFYSWFFRAILVFLQAGYASFSPMFHRQSFGWFSLQLFLLTPRGAVQFASRLFPSPVWMT